ncbi:hypothetical protein GV51_0005 [Gardnerella vaginalis 5-1]|nr:hypothetical protein GV51_0005 [Gardnerella vaginalis 5-1]
MLCMINIIDLRHAQNALTICMWLKVCYSQQVAKNAEN